MTKASIQIYLKQLGEQSRQRKLNQGPESIIPEAKKDQEAAGTHGISTRDKKSWIILQTGQTDKDKTEVDSICGGDAGDWTRDR